MLWNLQKKPTPIEPILKKIKVPSNQVFLEYRILKVRLPAFRVRSGTLNSNQFKECGCIIKFPSSHFNVLI